MKEIIEHKRHLAILQASLLKARNFYATASDEEKSKIAAEIIESEKQEELLRKAISTKEKRIRNTENVR
jgi:hypothetical protein